ncbi:MAG: Ig-like domain-containing protein [Planctomycetota bacterium]|nr:Ig-like domain-containing protein [Planctomycetota bacterium]
MVIRRSRPSPARGWRTGKNSAGKDANRKLFLEQLEDRRLLAVGPQIIGIQPNDGDLLLFDQPDQIRNTAPRELLFRFDENQVFSNANLDVIKSGQGGIRITRANLDGNFTAASVESDFNTGESTIRFTARKLGGEQNGITMVIAKRDQGGAGAPEIGVVGNRIDISLNVTPQNETTAQQLVDAINNDIDARDLVLAELVPDGAGTTFPDTNIASPPINYSPLQLSGANDVVVEPGYIGLGDSDNEILVRFAETLPDDLYQIDIFGEGSLALRNETNEAFQDPTDDGVDDGESLSLQFDLDLGAQIVSVVPQPVQRAADGSLSQARDQVIVYFNDDDLDPVSVEDPSFYQLISTKETVENTDDGDSHLPTTVVYNAALDAALLTFEAPLDQLLGEKDGTPLTSGSFRLRIGTDEHAPLVPATLDLYATSDPGSSYDTARSLTADWDTGKVFIVKADGSGFVDGSTFTVLDTDNNQQVFELDDQGGGVSAGNVAVTYDSTVPTSSADMAIAIRDAINGASVGGGLNVAATAVGDQVTVVGDREIVLDNQLRGLSLASQGIIVSQQIKVGDQPGEDDFVYDINFPGANDEPGHRDIDLGGELHLNGDADSENGITTVRYNFREDIGQIPGPAGTSQPAFNLITEIQKQRAREVFEIFSSVAGIQFVETVDEGIIVATGDLAAIPGGTSTPGAVIGLSGANADGQTIVIMDNAETWHDEVGRHRNGELSWFLVAMHELGHQMGLGHAYDLPPGTVMGLDSSEATGITEIEATEPVFPGDHDVVHLQHLHRPEGRDIDLYTFDFTERGVFTAETIAERRLNSRLGLDVEEGREDLLNTHLALYQVRVQLDPVSGEPVRDAAGQLQPILDSNGTEIRDLIARNDDYFSNDSFLELELREGTYYLAVSDSGNWRFDPAIEDTGMFGRSEGSYDLRLNFRPSADRAIVDQDNPVDAQRPEIIPTRIDADGDGVPGGVFNHWFRVAAPSGLEASGAARTVFVDKGAADGGNGTPQAPFNNLKDALNVDDSGIPVFPPDPSAVRPGDILRIVSNPGEDGDIRTELDNRGFELGFNDLGAVLSDGARFQVPQDVTVMVDAGTLFKMRRSWIGAGSVAPGASQNQSNGAIQVVGAPVFVDVLGNTLPLDGIFTVNGADGIEDTPDDVVPLVNLEGDGNESAAVHFTSYNDESLGLDTFTFVTTPEAGDWGGVIFQRNVDNADQTRFSYEGQGIFLDSINHADMRYGGGEVLVEGTAQIVDPIDIRDGRPTISFNEISFSRDAAISATPDSFLESNFHAPQYQTTPFTSDYSRIGPSILRNTLHDNTLNGLFVRIATPAGGDLQHLSVAGRWDDKDIVHVLKENLIIDGTPGGPFLETEQPSLALTTLSPLNHPQGQLAPGTYNYRLVFVDKDGYESAPSDATISRQLTAANNAIRLNQLITTSGDFVARRLYRSDNTGGGAYTLIATINQNDTEYIDRADDDIGGVLDERGFRVRSRLDASLRVDPSLIVKLDSVRIDLEPGSQMIAEGRDGNEIIFTHILDDRYGIGGTYDTTSDGVTEGTPGGWGGIHTTLSSRLSLDHSILAFGGGITRIEGTFAGFNVLEIHQAEARIANSIFEFNAGGVGGQAPDHRFGRGFNQPALLFVRGAQPIIVDNIFRDNTDQAANTSLAAININANSLNHVLKFDYGRSTGLIDAQPGYQQNHGPLVVGNRMGNNDINGMVVRGETLTTQGIWDDADIVHVLFDTITVPDMHTYGGLRLASSPTQSLVVKLESAPGRLAGFAATGDPLEINDRVGGVIQIIGQPKSPVVLTSLRNDRFGAGVDQDGDPQVDTNNSHTDRNQPDPVQPSQGDWNTILLDQYSHDRNMEIVIESEAFNADSPGVNATAQDAHYLGALAANEKSGDENLRLGFEVQGFLSNEFDVDVYSLEAEAGTEIWIDFDRTTYAFDPIVELVNSNDLPLAASYNSHDESAGTSPLFEHATASGTAFLTQKTPPLKGTDYWAVNPRDAGFRVVLPGPVGTRSNYYLRVRSNTALGDIHKTNDSSVPNGGLTSGAYQMQVRLNELDDFAGSTIRYADISYASTGITVRGLPLHSPLAGEGAEDEGRLNDTLAQAQALGNLMGVDRGTISVSGNLRTEFRSCFTGNPIDCPDVDWYTFEIDLQQVQAGSEGGFAGQSVVLDVDWADGLGRPDTELALFRVVPGLGPQMLFHSRDSNIAEDRPDPVISDQTEDLTRGTVGAGDAYIGPVFLGPGTYFVAVTGNGGGPNQLNNNPNLRLGPTSTLRLQRDNLTPVEDPMNSRGVLFDDESIVPWHLGDVGMFAVREITENLNFVTGSEITYNDPFTGDQEIAVGTFAQDVGDVAMRSDGLMFGYQLNKHIPGFPCPRRDDNAAVYLQVLDHTPTTMSGGVTVAGASTIQTFELNAAGDDFERANLCDGDRVGFGFQVNAMMFGGVENNSLNTERLLVVGERRDLNIPNGVDIKRNIMFEMDPETGGVLHIDADAQDVGPSTNAYMVGQILTGAQLTVADATSQNFGGTTIFEVEDGDTFTVDENGMVTTFEIDFGPQVLQNFDLASEEVLKDGDFFLLDTDADDPALANEHLFQIDTGSVIHLLPAAGGGNENQVVDGTRVTIQDAIGAAVASFEFDPLGDGLVDTAAVAVGGFTTNVTDAGLVAGLLQAQINGNAGLAGAGVVATLAGNRLSLTNEGTITLNLSGGTESIRIEGDRGTNPIVQVGDGTEVSDGDTITVTLNTVPVVFELDTDGSVGAGNFAVAFTDGSGGSPDTAEEIADTLQLAIEASNTGLTAKHAGGLVSINGKGLTDGTPGGGEIAITVANPGAIIQREIRGTVQVEETDAETVTGPVVAATVDAATIGVDASAAFDRISFLGAETGDFRGVGEPTWLDRATLGGVVQGNVRVPLLAEDVAANGTDATGNPVTGVAQKIADAINANYPDPDSVSATAIGSTVDVENGQLNTDEIVFNVQGGGPGGDITGITTLPGGAGSGVSSGQIFAVSDQGGLYEVNVRLDIDFIEIGAGISSQDWVETSQADLNGIAFQGLTRGPENVEDGKYENLLFGIDEDGRVYAFDHDGILQPIFNDGTTSIDLGVDSIVGFSFSTLGQTLMGYTHPNDVPNGGFPVNPDSADKRDRLYNLPNCRTDDVNRNGQVAEPGEPICVHERETDPGHGHITTEDPLLLLSPPPVPALVQPGPTSLHFGEGFVVSSTDAGNTPARTYDYPGGAHGTAVSNEFSLRDYSAADRPIMYFSYWLESGGNDPARVFISDNDGDWQLLADLANTGGIWRQQRIPLEAFAGVDHLRLRIDMSTGGGMGIGPLSATGTELRTVPGHFIRDGEFVQIDDHFFEFESGFTLVTPSAAAILADAAGNTTSAADRQFTITDGNGDIQTYEFTDDPGSVAAGIRPIEINEFETADEIASRMRLRMVTDPALDLDLQNTHRNDGTVDVFGNLEFHGERVNLGFDFDDTGVTDVTASPYLETLGFLEGQSGSNFDPADPASPDPEDVTLVFVHEEMSREDVADELNRLLEPNYYSPTIVAVEGLFGQGPPADPNNSDRLDDGDTFTLSDGVNPVVTFEFDSGFVIEMPSNGGVDISDTETLTFSHLDPDGTPGNADDNTALVLEFDKQGDGVAAGNVPVVVTDLMTQIEVANAVEAAITGDTSAEKATLGLEGAKVLSGGRVQVFAISGTQATPSGANVIVSTDHSPDLDPASVQVRYEPTGSFSAADTADSIADAINNGVDAHPGVDGIEGNTDDPVLEISAAVQTESQRRVNLTRVGGPNSQIEFTTTISPLTLELEQDDVIGNDIIKQHNDLLRIIGHTVVDAGPLGFDEALAGDSGAFNSAARLQDNRFEGLYVDDISIGFIERGQRVVTGSSTDATAVGGTTDGEYTLEIRPADPTLLLDTNDRMGQHYTIEVPDGADIHDGQTFDISDGINTVRFEYDEEVSQDGVESGNVRVSFNSTMADWEVARAVRDAVNTSPVRAKLNVTAALSDGANGILVPDLDPEAGRPDVRTGASGQVTTSNKVNLFGPVFVLSETDDPGAQVGTPPQTVPEPNEILLNATETGITGTNSRSVVKRGSIGDNGIFASSPGLDVDLFRVELAQGDELRIDVESELSAIPAATGDEIVVVRVFDALGAELFVDASSANPNVTFTAPNSGNSTYFIGVSGAGNTSYDPATGLSAVVGSIGTYQLHMHFGDTHSAQEPLAFDGLGDQNHFRDQGQLLIHSNRISESENFGIDVRSADRDAADGNSPHPGPPRHLEEINQDRLLPGVVIANNLVTRNAAGGIHFSGDNGAGPAGPVVFGRIYNNTVVGLAGTLVANPGATADIGIEIGASASPTLLNNVVANTALGLQIDPTSSSTVVGAMLYQGNVQDAPGVSEDFEIVVGIGDPLFVEPAGSEPNYYLAPGTPDLTNKAIDSSIASLEERFRFNLIKEPVGIAPSPIIAPDRDVTGQLRVDDPATEPAGGLGSNVFIDRGAIDRSDFSGPVAEIVQPRDNDSDGNDLNLGSTVVELSGNAIVSSFQVRLNDGIEPADPNEGIGISDLSVQSEKVLVTRDGILLKDTIDYSYSYNTTNDTIQLTPLAGIWPQDHIYTINLINTDQFKVVAPDGNVIDDAESFSIVDLDGELTRFEYERGFTFQVPQTLEIQVPSEGGGFGGIVDGDIFTVRQGTSPPKTFEFDRDGNFGQNRFVINFTVTSTPEQIASDIKDALVAVDIGLSPVVLPGARVHLGSKLEHTLDTNLSNLTQSGVADGVADGGFFTIDNSNQLVTFEFEDDDIGDDVTTGNVAIHFTQANTYEEIADKLVAAIAAENLGLAPQNLGAGLIYVGGTVNHVVDTSSSKISDFGQPGVQPALSLRIPTDAGQPSGLLDAETFTIQLAPSPAVTFELNNTDVDSDFTLGNVRIDFTDSSTVAEIASGIVVAIQGAGLNMDPVHVTGTSIITLGEDKLANYTLDFTNTSLFQLGTPGVDAAVSVDILPVAEFDATQVAVRMIQAINGDDNLSGVSALATGGASIGITGAAQVADNNLIFLPDASGVATPRFIEEIEDLATNPLKANQLSGETKFTVILGSINADLGDAADGVGQPPQASYPVLTSHDGAIHMVTDSPLFLGERVDRDQEGQPLADAQGDDLDGDNYVVDTTNTSVDTITGNISSTPISLGIAQTFRLVLPAGGAAVLGDGESFTVSQGANSETFELDNDASVGAGNTAIVFTVSDTLDQVADAIVSALDAAGLGLAPSNLGGGVVHLGSSAGHVLDASLAPSLTASGQAGNVADGETFSITSGATQAIFEFEDQNLLNSVTFGNFSIPFSAADTHDQIAASMIAAMETAVIDAGVALNLNPIARGNGLVELDGDDEDGVTGPAGGPIGFFNAFVTTELEVTASDFGYLDAWIDFNRDGDWDDDQEQVFANQRLDAGLNTLSISTPLSPASKAGDTFARFRFSSTGGLTATGLAADGEVEDYLIEIVDGSPPQATDDPSPSATSLYTTTEDALLNGPSVLANDSDADGDAFQVNVFDNPSLLGAVVNVNTDFNNVGGAGTFTYDPTLAAQLQALNEGEVAGDSFTYGLIESSAHNFQSQTPGTVTITVTGVNDVPTAADVAIAADEDGVTVDGSFAGDDEDAENDVSNLVYIVKTDLPLGSGAVTNNGDGTFTFDPKQNVDFQQLAEDETLDVTFTYTATDLQGIESSEGTVTVTVTGANDPPVAVNDAYATDQDTPLTTTGANGVLSNDSDPDNGDIPVVIELNSNSANINADVTTSLGATVNMQANGTFSYDPTTSATLRALDQDVTLTDMFTYTIQDGEGVTASATVSITVNGVNNAPVAADDSYEVDQDKILTVPGPESLALLVDNDSDVDTNASLSVVAINAGATTQGGEVTVATDGSFVYDPSGSAALQALARDVDGTDTFSYTLTDGSLTDTATVTITVHGVNKNPVANPDAYGTDEDTTIFIDAANGLIQGAGADTDPETDTLTVTGIQGSGSRSGLSDLGAQVDVTSSGGLTYNPNHDVDQVLNVLIQALNDGETLNDTFDYTISDGNGGTATAEVTIALTGINDAPQAIDDLSTTPRDTAVVIPVTSNDTDVDGTVDGSTITVTEDPSAGTATVNSDGTITFDPPAATSGTFTIKYTVRDDSLATSNEATVTVLVNDPPVANPDTVTAILDVQNTASEFNILANDTDTEGGIDPSTVTIITGTDASKGVIEEVRSDGTVVYRPTTTVTTPAVDSFTYTVSDSDGAVSDPATVTINIVEDPAPWQNRSNVLDVNGDTVVSPIDALLIITYLNDNGPGPLPVPTGSFQPPPYLDPTGDNEVNPTDVLQIIDFLNAQGGGEGEGEGESLEQYVQQAASSRLDVGILSSSQQVVLDSDSQEQADGGERPAPEAVTIDNSQYQAATARTANRRAEGLKIADSESLEDLLEVIADDLADSAEASAHDSAIEQWFSRYTDN